MDKPQIGRSLSSMSNEVDGSKSRIKRSSVAINMNKAITTEKNIKRAQSIKREIKKLSFAFDDFKNGDTSPFSRKEKIASMKPDSRRGENKLSSRNALNPHVTSDPATILENEMNMVRQLSSFLEVVGHDEQQAGCGKETSAPELSDSVAKKSPKPSKMTGLIRMLSGNNSLMQSDSDSSSAESIKDVVDKKAGLFKPISKETENFQADQASPKD